MTTELHFIPTRVDGLSAVSAATVYPDRIELTTEAGRVTHRFADIARWRSPRWFWRVMHRAGIRPRWLPVADRDWFHDGPDMFFEFYTEPRLKVFMPADETKESYGGTCFVRIQNVIRAGGFHTNDLG